MQIEFELKHKNNKNISPTQIMKDNVFDLEEICKKAIKRKDTVILISPEEFKKPKNVYELSALIAEDLVKKYNEQNIILRK